jgi:hypothetical protein
MGVVRTYRMTVASSWYDKKEGCQREYEMHFKATRTGRLRNIRRYLAKRGVPYFQQTIYRMYRRWIPKRTIRVAFEREQPALKSDRLIQIEFRGMQYRGKRWKAIPLPTRVLSYVKKKRKRRLHRIHKKLQMEVK